ncbi:MAG: DUF1844 domain-containing protein [Planctomycetes bacterium]|nr:DUF1844 domain-containing protein [Planctomycetota bacterium]
MSEIEPASTPEIPEASFLNFLKHGLASQALMQLGMVPNPMSGEREVNLPYAQYSIELLSVLKEKSEGNRTDDETRYLEGVLADLTFQLDKLKSEGLG